MLRIFYKCNLNHWQPYLEALFVRALRTWSVTLSRALQTLHEKVNVVDECIVRLDESRIELHRATVAVILPTITRTVAFVCSHHWCENRRLRRSQEKFLYNRNNFCTRKIDHIFSGHNLSPSFPIEEKLGLNSPLFASGEGFRRLSCKKSRNSHTLVPVVVTSIFYGI